jgi:hypothetical protein
VSDNIPTTADVRDAYSSESSDSTYANRMFDLWLAKYKAKIIAKTEERIIKVLEDYIPTFYELSPNSDAGKYPIEGIIALIKGENK